MLRSDLLVILTEIVTQAPKPHPIRVAIDGVDAAGKTTLANELAVCIRATGRPVISASIDGFHRPRAERYRRGTNSPEGYYLDSFDNEAIRSSLLLPLGPEGSRSYRRRVFDFRTDSAVKDSIEQAEDDAILLFDGVFLLRPELNDCWDLRIFVAADFDETVKRAQRRDLALFGSQEAVLRRYQERYIPGQQLYLAAVRPHEIADVVVDNNNPGEPGLILLG